MKHFLVAAVLGSAVLAGTALAADVGVSINVGQPGFYGQIDIGDFPRPVVIYRQPVMVERIVEERPPIYLHVPPGHIKNWKRHCREYNACGERVFFVRDDWYNREYVPRYQNRYPDQYRRDEYHDHDRHDHDNHDHYDNHDDHGNDRRHDHERGDEH